jgi:hypothetical protein
MRLESNGLEPHSARRPDALHRRINRIRDRGRRPARWVLLEQNLSEISRPTTCDVSRATLRGPGPTGSGSQAVLNHPQLSLSLWRPCGRPPEHFPNGAEKFAAQVVEEKSKPEWYLAPPLPGSTKQPLCRNRYPGALFISWRCRTDVSVSPRTPETRLTSDCPRHCNTAVRGQSW